MRPSASQNWPLVAPDWIQNGPEWLNDIGYDIYKSLLSNMMEEIEGKSGIHYLKILARE